MSELAVSVLAGVAFGLALAAPPGPMNAIIAEESVLRGWSSGFSAGLGAMTADVLFCALAFVGVVAVVEHAPTLRAGMITVGGLMMCYFAYGAAREALAGAGALGAGANAGAADGGSHGFRKTFVLSLTNPYQIVFWLTVGVRLLQPEPLDVFAHLPYAGEALAGTLVVSTGSPALLVGFFAGIALWITAFPATLVAVGRRIDRFAPAVVWASALVLAGFGAVFLADGIGTLR